MTVDQYRGEFSISVTGHINAGEFSVAAVRREVEEELGLDPARLQIDCLFSYYQEAVLNETYIDRQFNDVYVTRAEIEPERIRFDRSEVAEVKFVALAAFQEMVVSAAAELAPAELRL